MLVYTNIPISQVALEASYESQQAFTLAFRGLYLKTPLLYRETGEFKPLQLVFSTIPKKQRISANAIYTKLYYINQYKKEMKAA
jgi:AraC-like DNA-binding protein